LLVLSSAFIFAAGEQNSTKEAPTEEAPKEFAVNMEAWNFYDFVELKKDQVAKYSLVIDNKTFEVQFRWTLYVNDALTMLYKYGGFNRQNVLYAKYRLDGFKIDLKERATNAIYCPYMYISFKNYDKKTKKALFHVFIKDEKRSILVDRVLPKTD
jgi:hypothetical protein